jgi:hypothetical protein
MSEIQDVNQIIKVLKLIDRRDYEIPREIKIKNQKDAFGFEFNTYENNFVTKFNEIYAHLEFNGKIPRRLDLQRQLQIPKVYIWSEHKDPKVTLHYNELKKRYGDSIENHAEFETIPDFFIHKDQNDRNPKNQRLIIEFKTEFNLPENRFMWDFFKLNLYLEKYNFQTACFVGINNSRQRIGDYLFEYLEKEYYQASDMNRLHIILKESYDSDIYHTSFQNFARDTGHR